ncbi:MAG TPA: phosphopantetheine-binding protein [Patescibacteria group bacterium]|nr:phosphopantetheine-binding protein [Patescibacteria group bacterium]
MTEQKKPSQTFQQLQKICSEITGTDESEIRSSTSFFEDLGVSMEELAEIFARTSETFNIKISKNDVASMTTVGELLVFVEEQL